MAIAYLLAILLILAFFRTLKRFQEQLIGSGEALLWSILWLGATIVVLRPELASLMASWFKIGRGVDLVVYLAIVVIFWMLFRIFVQLEKFEREITTLVRHQALKDQRDTSRQDNSSVK